MFLHLKRTDDKHVKPEIEEVVQTIRKQYKMTSLKRGFRVESKNAKNAVSDAV